MRKLIAFALAVLLLGQSAADAITIDTVPIEHPGNAPDFQPQGLFGSVATSYRMATTPVTNAQYAEFLNAVAATDPYELYHPWMGLFSQGGIIREGSPGSHTYSVKPDVLVEPDGGGSFLYTYDDKPVVFISWFDAVRFANWMHNGQGNGDTETGAYTLTGGTPVPADPHTIQRNADATWFLPTENEWYKAAYYDGDAGQYFTFPTGSDEPPNNNLPAADTGNSANFLDGQTTTGDPGYPHTPVGAYALSSSPYGTFDQGGNVREWSETLNSPSIDQRVVRGGAWDDTVDVLAASHRGATNHALHHQSIGFRLATIADFALPGDFNGDGVVDAADYVLWRKSDGTAPGYDQWRGNFGSTDQSGTAMALVSNAVPEPAAPGMLLAMLTALVARRPRRTVDVQHARPRARVR